MKRKPPSMPQASRLSDEDVRRLREWKPFKAVAHELGIEYSYARRVRNGEYRKHVQ